MGIERRHGYCTLCRSRCGALYSVDGNRLLSVAPDPDHPTGAALCPKGRAAPEIVHSPRRLTHPLRRTAPKTADDPGWVQVGWEEALAEIARRFDQIRRDSGPEAVAFSVTSPSGTPISDGIDWVERFIRLFGSPNIAYATEICNWHKDHAHASTFGCGIPTADYAKHRPGAAVGAQPGPRLARPVHRDRRGTRAGRCGGRSRPPGGRQWRAGRPLGSSTARLRRRACARVANRLINAGRFDDDFVRRGATAHCWCGKTRAGSCAARSWPMG